MLEAGKSAPIEAHLKHCLFLASLVVLWAAAALCDTINYCEKEHGWAVACGTVSTFIMLLLHVPGVGAQLSTLDRPIAAFLALWWTFGVAIMTFKAPFTIASNGFFGAWAGFISAVALARYEFAGEIDSLNHGGGGGGQSNTGGIGGADDAAYVAYSPPTAPSNAPHPPSY